MIRARQLLRRADAYAVMSVALLTCAILLAPMLTRSMTLHMLAHIPLILAAGIFMGAALQVSAWPYRIARRPILRSYGKYNEYGVPGLLMCTFVAAYWMIPK